MRTKKGVVTGTKMTGTVTVTVHRHSFHPIYRKKFRRSKKFLADCNGHDLYEGDLVTISECRPLSKNKCFKVTEILQAAPRVSDVKEDEAVEKAIHREKVGADAEAKEKKSQEEAKKEAKKNETTDDAPAEESASEESADDTDSPSEE